MKSGLNFFLVFCVDDLRRMGRCCLKINLLFQNSIVLLIPKCWVFCVWSVRSLSWLSSLFNKRCEFVLSFKFPSLNAQWIDCDLNDVWSIRVLFLCLINLRRFKSHVLVQILSRRFDNRSLLLIHCKASSDDNFCDSHQITIFWSSTIWSFWSLIIMINVLGTWLNCYLWRHLVFSKVHFLQVSNIW